MSQILTAPNGTTIIVTDSPGSPPSTLSLIGNTFEVDGRNAQINMTANASVEVMGPFNQINMNSGSTLTLDDHDDHVNAPAGSTIIFGRDAFGIPGTNNFINGSNITIQAQSGRTLFLNGANDTIFANNDVIRFEGSSLNGSVIIGSGNTVTFNNPPPSNAAAQAVSHIVNTGVDQLVQALAALPGQSAGAMHEFGDRDGFATKASLAEPLMSRAEHLSHARL